MDRALIDKVTKEVIAALERSGAVAAAGSAAAAGAARPAAKAAAAGRRFLTADDVRERLAHGHGVQLSANEFLTPAAQDMVQLRELTVTRKAEPATEAPAVRASQAISPQNLPVAPRGGVGGAPVGLIVHKADEKVQAVLAALSREGLRLLDCSAAACPIANTITMCEALATGRLSLGVAILPYAADAVVLANKFPGVMAVQGTHRESVAAAVRHLGANLLVLEHSLSTFHELRAMASVFVRDRMLTGVATDVLAAIARMEKR